MARTAFVVDEAMRERVRYLAGVGVRLDDIARIIRRAPKTLRKRFRDELDRSVAEANATVCGYLFAAAKAGNIPAIIFWLKTRAHWREGTAPDAPPRADAEADSQVLLVLPDHSRDAELTQVSRNAQEDCFARRPPGPGLGKSDLIARGSEEGQIGRPRSLSTFPPIPLVTGIGAKVARAPRRRECDKCRLHPDLSSRRSLGRRPHFCEPGRHLNLWRRGRRRERRSD